MLENLTIINIDSLLNIASDVKSGKSLNSYMDKSNKPSNFANIFEKANKTFHKDENQHKSVASKVKTTEKDKTENPVHSTDKKDKVKSSTDNEKKIKNTDEKQKNKIEKSTDAKPSSKSEKTDEKTEKPDDKDKTNKTKSTKVLVEILPQIATINAGLNADLKETDTKISDETKTLQPVQDQNIQKILNANSEKLIQNLATTNEQKPKNLKNTQDSPQTKEVLPNVRMKQPQLQELKEDINKLQTQSTGTQTPVVKVSAEVLASNVNINQIANDSNPKQNLKNMLQKTSLTQDMLDKTNAKIVNISTSNSSNSNNLLNQQNPEEHSIKLSIQGNNLSELTGQTTQAKFIQTLNEVQPQAPKELNKANILSQIHNKLNNIQDKSTTTINIVLKPKGLGRINLELINGKDGLSAKMTTDNAQIKDLLDKSLNSLKNTLGNQGVNVNTVTIKVENTQAQSNDMSSFQQGQQNTANQEFSNNNQNQNQNEFSLSEEIDNFVTTTETDGEIKDTNFTNLRLGQIDYKI